MTFKPGALLEEIDDVFANDGVSFTKEELEQQRKEFNEKQNREVEQRNKEHEEKKLRDKQERSSLKIVKQRNQQAQQKETAKKAEEKLKQDAEIQAQILAKKNEDQALVKGFIKESGMKRGSKKEGTVVEPTNYTGKNKVSVDVDVSPNVFIRSNLFWHRTGGTVKKNTPVEVYETSKYKLFYTGQKLTAEHLKILLFLIRNARNKKLNAGFVSFRDLARELGKKAGTGTIQTIQGMIEDLYTGTIKYIPTTKTEFGEYVFSKGALYGKFISEMAIGQFESYGGLYKAKGVAFKLHTSMIKTFFAEYTQLIMLDFNSSFADPLFCFFQTHSNKMKIKGSTLLPFLNVEFVEPSKAKTDEQKAELEKTLYNQKIKYKFELNKAVKEINSLNTGMVLELYCIADHDFVIDLKSNVKITHTEATRLLNEKKKSQEKKKSKTKTEKKSTKSDQAQEARSQRAKLVL